MRDSASFRFWVRLHSLYEEGSKSEGCIKEYLPSSV